MLDQGKKYVKKFALIFCLIVFIAFNATADIIFFKDGMKTVCKEKAWEEEGEVRCEYDGAILSYEKKDVIRIEKTRIEKPPESLPDKEPQMPIKAAAKQATSVSKIKKPDPSEKKSSAPKKTKIFSKKLDSSKAEGLQFYNPRRPQKYWTGAASKHHSFKEAIATLAKQYDRSPEWIQHHMGETNDLSEIHQNLSTGKLNTPAAVPEDDKGKIPEILFYNPRRPQKYWTNASSKHNTFKEAITAMAREYERTPQWVQQYMGTTNNLSEIHQNLANQKEVETSR
jgi:hypothetical protein